MSVNRLLQAGLISCLLTLILSSASAANPRLDNPPRQDEKEHLESLRRSGYEGPLDLDELGIDPSFSGDLQTKQSTPPILSVAGDEFWWDGFGGSAINSEVTAMAMYQGNLYAGGLFTSAGGVPGTSRIARWDGTQWHALGVGMNGTVRAMTVYQGELIVGGSFGNSGGVSTDFVVRWNGSTWLPFGNGANNIVYSLEVQGDTLIIGGDFTQIAGVAANRIAWWDGVAVIFPQFDGHVTKGG